MAKLCVTFIISGGRDGTLLIKEAGRKIRTARRRTFASTFSPDTRPIPAINYLSISVVEQERITWK